MDTGHKGMAVRGKGILAVKGCTTVKPLYKAGLGTPGVILIEEVSL